MLKNKVIFIPIVVSLIAGIIYLYTAAPSMLLLDAGDLIAAAKTFGVSNPPVPLYILLAHFFTIIPFGSIIFRLQLLSALLAVITLWVIYNLIVKILKIANTEKKAPVCTKTQSIYTALFSTISLAFSYAFWTQAQNTERFILVCLIEVIVLYLTIIIFTKKSAFSLTLLLCLLVGFSTGSDPVVISFFPSILFLLWSKRKDLSPLHVLAFGCAGIIGGIVIYSYLPIASSHNPFFNYLRPTTFSGVWQVATGQGLNVNDSNSSHVNGFTGSLDIFLQSAGHFFEMLWLSFTPFILPFILLGGIYLYILHKRFFIFLILIVVTNFLLSGIYFSGNQDSWYLLSDICFAVFAGFGYLLLSVKIVPYLCKKYKYTYRNWFGLVLLFFSAIPLFFWWTTTDRHTWKITDDYIHNLYTPIKEPAILFGGSDLFVDTSYYVHDATRMKQHVIPIIDTEFYLIKSYRQNLQFTTDIKIPSNSHMTFANKAEYNKFVNDFFALNIQKYKIYITLSALADNFILTQHATPSFTLDTNRFKLVPAGLSEEVVLKTSNEKTNIQNFNYQFSSGFPKRRPQFLENSYTQQITDMISEYTQSFNTIGDYFAKNNNLADATVYLQKAYTIDQTNKQTLLALASVFETQKQYQKSIFYFTKALSLDPQNPQILYDLAICNVMTGDKMKAANLLHQVLSFSQDDARTSAQAINTLHTLGEQTNQSSENWNVFSDTDLNLAFFYPLGLEARKTNDNLVEIFANGENPDSSIAEFYSGMLDNSVDLQTFAKTFPYAVEGKLTLSQPENIDGFDEAVTNLYTAQDNTKTNLFLLRHDNQVIAIIVSFKAGITTPDEAAALTKMIQSVTTLH